MINVVVRVTTQMGNTPTIKKVFQRRVSPELGHRLMFAGPYDLKVVSVIHPENPEEVIIGTEFVQFEQLMTLKHEPGWEIVE
jgi:hypothetical protein